MHMKEILLTNTAKDILFNPVSQGANHLCILTDNAAPSMVSWLLKSYEDQEITGITIDLIIRNIMKDGVDELSHKSFIKLHSSRYLNHFSCSYIHEKISSKENLYIWLNGEMPIVSFLCHFDFTQTSFIQEEQTAFEISNTTSSLKCYEDAIDHSIYCNHAELEEYILIRSTEVPSINKTSNSSGLCVSLPLITKRTGEPGKKSGLNWGQRKNRNKNEAYIPLPRKIARSGFFPLNEQHFLVLTDDHHTLQLRVEQEGDKAITTPASNALLGEYFRNRLGLANGAYVHSEDLLKYGRTDVTFYKFDEEQYYMDFSSNWEGD